MEQIDGNDLSRGQKLEMLVVAFSVVLSAIFVLQPILAGLHPMFVWDLTEGRMVFLYSPAGVAVYVYCIVLFVSYSYVRYPFVFDSVR